MTHVRVSCDSVVAMRPLTRGAAIFAKNSDRPAGECQPLFQAAAADHPRGAELRCQYIVIEQAEHTHAFVGSRPYWLWGLEHGVNEHGVAIGNHTIFTKDPVADIGLLGMDLVRLGLERGASAREAIEVIIDLVERHGQGGSGYADTVWPYHNSFLVADARNAFLLEASARDWALRDVERGASATNHVTIARDWSRVSAGCEPHARAQGWWTAPDPIDFAAAYRDTSVAPPIISSARYAATCGALASADGRLDVAAFARLMRHHPRGSEAYEPAFAPDDERYYSVCMHADPVGTTTASMIVELEEPREGRVRPLWVAFCNPCVAPYLPVFLEGSLPEAMTAGGAGPESGGAWWRFKRLLSAVESDWARNAPLVRDYWRAFERELRVSTGELLAAPSVAQRARRERVLTEYMQRVCDDTLARVDDIEERLS